MHPLLKNSWFKRGAGVAAVLLAGYAGLYLLGGPRRLFGKKYTATALAAPVGNGTGFTLMPAGQTGVTFSNTISDEIAGKNRVLDIGSGVALGDYDGDGLCDVYFCRMDGDNVLYRNLGEWRFEDVTAKAGVACPDVFATGATFADIDGDRDLDLLVASIPGLRCYRNNGSGGFADATAETGLASKTANTTLALADVEGDGDLDLYLTSYRPDSLKDIGNVKLRMVNGKLTVPPEQRDRLTVVNGVLQELGEPDTLYLNDGSGKFTPQSWTGGAFLDEDGAKLAKPPLDWGLTATLRDMDGDGDPDIYVCNDFQSTESIWINQGTGTFRAIDRLAIRSTSASAMGVDFSDVDRDGDLDFFVADMLSHEHARRNTQMPITGLIGGALGEIENRPQIPRNTLFLNRGDGTYAECADYAGISGTDWTWTALFFDADLDGYEDLYVANGHARDVQDADTGLRLDAMGDAAGPAQQSYKLYPRLDTPNMAFRNLGNLRFEDTSRAWGLDATGISHGAAHADLDNDGDLDLVVNNFQQPAGLYRNDSPAPRIAVKLAGEAPNTQGTGATIRLKGGPVGVQSKEITTGGLYLSGSEATASFAAGEPSGPMTLEVTWRAGTVSVVENVQAGMLYTMHESGSYGAAPSKPAAPGAMFEDVSARLNHIHRENDFDDFVRQPLLPKRLSRPGPGVAWHDLDGDGDDDLLVGTGAGGVPGVFINDGRGSFTPFATGLTARFSRDVTGVLGWTESQNASGILLGASNFEDGASDGEAVLRYAVSGGGLTPGTGIAGQPSGTGPLAMADVDGDGDLDLFVGGRSIPGKYPEAASSLLLRNDGGRFTVDAAASGVFASVGLVNGAVFSDLDADGDADLALAVEWGPVTVFLNDGGAFQNATARLGLDETRGWWNGVTAGDFDEDGRMDLVVTNWGENVPFRPGGAQSPLKVFSADFDGNGTLDVIEAYRDPSTGTWLPIRRYDVISKAIPAIAAKFPAFEAYAKATLEQLYGPALASARSLAATTLAHTVFLNRGARFEAAPLPFEAQLAPAFGVTVADFDGDGHDDLFVAQNFFAVPAKTPRFDGGRGLILKGDGRGGFESVPGQQSGIKIHGDGRGAAVADFDGDARPDVAAGQNGAATKLYRNALGKPGLRVRLQAAAGNPGGAGATIRLVYGERKGPAREVRAGSGYLSQDSAVQVLGGVDGATGIWVRWPGGQEQTVPFPSGGKEVRIERQ